MISLKKRVNSQPGYLRHQVVTAGNTPRLLRQHSDCSNTQYCVFFYYTLSQEGNKSSTGFSSTTGHLEDANGHFHLLSEGKLQQSGGFPLDNINICSHHSTLSHTEHRKQQMTEGCKNSRSAIENERQWLHLLDLQVNDEGLLKYLHWTQKKTKHWVAYSENYMYVTWVMDGWILWLHESAPQVTHTRCYDPQSVSRGAEKQSNKMDGRCNKVCHRNPLAKHFTFTGPWRPFKARSQTGWTE